MVFFQASLLSDRTKVWVEYNPKEQYLTPPTGAPAAVWAAQYAQDYAGENLPPEFM